MIPPREPVVETLPQACQPFDMLLDQLTEKIQSNNSEDIEAFLCAHPGQEQQLRQILPTIRAMAEIGAPEEDHNGSAPTTRDGANLAGGRALGDFRLVREIGRGGMGVVYEAEQLSLPRRVALKVLPFAAVLDKRQLQRFQTEARAAATLDHPGIVSVYSVGCERGVHYYAMQLIEGQTLAQVISQLRQLTGVDRPAQPEQSGAVSQLTSDLASGCFASSSQSASADDPTTGDSKTELQEAPPAAETPPTPQAAISTDYSTRTPKFLRTVTDLGIQAAEALDHAHVRGVLHRDIKPGNLMLDAEGKLRITDFGLARIEADPGMTMTGDILGTLRYMSPEQALAKRVVVDQRADIYSLGVTLYELLTLEPAFKGNDRAELLKQIAFEEPRPPCQLNKAVPRDLGTIIIKAMEKNPEERYATAQDLADDLNHFLKNEPIKAKRPTLLQRVAKWSRRHKGLVRTAAAALVLLTIISAASTALIARARSDIAAALEREKAGHEEAHRLQRLAERQTVRAEQLAYAADIRLAGQAYEAGDIRQALELADRYRPEEGRHDHRGYEWYWLERACRGDGVSWARHDAALYNVNFSPDGRSIAVVGADGMVRIRDAATGKLRTEWATQQGEVNCAVFSPDGKTLATAGDDGTVKLWELPSQRCLQTIQAYEELAFSVCFVRGGTLLATCGANRAIGLWEVKTGLPRGILLRTPVPYDPIQDLAVSPDGKLLATAESDHCARIWDLEARQAVQRHETNEKLMSVAFAPSGRWFVACGMSKELYGWAIEANEPLFTTKLADQGQCVAVSSDGRWIAVGERGGTVRFLQVAGGNPRNDADVVERRALHLHEGRVYGVAFSPIAERLISVGQDGRVVALGQESFRPRETVVEGLGEVRGVASFDDRDLVATAGVAGVHLVRLDTGEIVCRFEGSDSDSHQIVVSPDGRNLAVGVASGGVQIWDVASRTIRQRLPFPGLHVDQLEFSPAGDALAAILDRALILIDVETGQVDSDFSRSGDDSWVAFSPDRSTMAVARGMTNTIEIWDRQRKVRTHTFTGQEGGTRRIAFGPDGDRLAALDSSRRLTVWNATRGTERFSALIGLEHVDALAFLGRGESLMLAAGDVVELWHVATGQRLMGLDLMAAGDGGWTVCRRGRYFCRLRGKGSEQRLGIVAGAVVEPTRNVHEER